MNTYAYITQSKVICWLHRKVTHLYSLGTSDGGGGGGIGGGEEDDDDVKSSYLLSTYFLGNALSLSTVCVI